MFRQKVFQKSVGLFSLFLGASAISLPAMAVYIPPHTVPAGYTFQPLDSDGFGGTAFNTVKWTREKVGQTRHDSILANRSAVVAAGKMHVRAFTLEDNNGVQTHQSSVVVSNEKYRFGYFESKIKFEIKPGTWAGFWLFDPSIWQNRGGVENPRQEGVEVDIAEYVLYQGGQDRSNQMHHARHWNGYFSGHPQEDEWTSTATASELASDPTLFADASEWNTYALEWTPSKYVFYINGHEVWREDDPNLISQIPQRVQYSMEVRDDPNNYWAGSIPAGGYGANPWASQASKMQVDYFKYASLNGFPSSVPEPASLGLLSLGAVLMRRRRGVQG